MHINKMIRITTSRRLSTLQNILPCRYIHSSSTSTSEKVKEEEPAADTNDILEDISKQELSEEDILRKQFKSRLPERVYRAFVLKEALPLEQKDDFKLNRLQKYYGKFGADSKLNPGICWPTREEVLEIMYYDRKFEPPLQERIKNVETKRLEEEQRKRAVEEEVEKNMSNLDKWMSEYHSKLEKKKAKSEQLKMERERLVEEISEYLGYDIDPRDPRFKEAVEQRDKEKKKEMKLKKQKESYDKMLEKLKKIAQNQ